MRTEPAHITPACAYCNNDHNPAIECRFTPVSIRGHLREETRTKDAMGYSCTKAAMDTVNALQAIHGQEPSQNTFTNPVTKISYFWEIGRERADGAIVGTVEENLPGDLCRRAGNFKIDPMGVIVAWPGIPREHWPAIEKLGQQGSEAIERYKRNKRSSASAHAPAHGH